MEKKETFVGIDVSKYTLDVAIYGIKDQIKILNNSEGFKLLVAFLRSYHLKFSDCWFVLEFTGGYEYRLLQFCHAKNIKVTRIPGLEIKRSLGMHRGKNDKIDAKRIASYGYEKKERLKPHTACNTAIEQLKLLLRQRTSFVKDRKAHEQQMKELAFMLELKKSDKILKRYEQAFKYAHRQVLDIEKEIMKLFLSYPELNRNLQLISSIPGIGPVNAWLTIAYTNNFENFENGRKYGAYCGVVPYQNRSGLYKGVNRTSKLANQEIKASLHMAAKAAVQHDQELQQHYKRKEQLGKHHLSIMNEIMFKLILRMFAVVKKGDFFVEKQKIAA